MYKNHLKGKSKTFVTFIFFLLIYLSLPACRLPLFLTFPSLPGESFRWSVSNDSVEAPKIECSSESGDGDLDAGMVGREIETEEKGLNSSDWSNLRIWRGGNEGGREGGREGDDD